MKISTALSALADSVQMRESELGAVRINNSVLVPPQNLQLRIQLPNVDYGHGWKRQKGPSWFLTGQPAARKIKAYSATLHVYVTLK